MKPESEGLPPELGPLLRKYREARQWWRQCHRSKTEARADDSPGHHERWQEAVLLTSRAGQDELRAWQALAEAIDAWAVKP